VGSEAQGIADEGAHDGAGGAIQDVFAHHILLLVFLKSLQVVSQSQTLTSIRP
jgi:hypothetical protein